MNLYEHVFFHQYLESGEKLMYTMHKHWIVVYRKMLEIGFFGIAIPAGILFFFFEFNSLPAYALYAWIGLGILASLYAFTDWYADAWLLTDKSIIDVHWDGFLRRSAQRIGYSSIESIIYEIKGFKATLFNYGTLTLNNESGNTIVIQNISNPKKAEAKLTEMRNALAEQSGQDNLEVLKDLLANVIEEKLNKAGKGR